MSMEAGGGLMGWMHEMMLILRVTGNYGAMMRVEGMDTLVREGVSEEVGKEAHWKRSTLEKKHIDLVQSAVAALSFVLSPFLTL